MNEYFDLVSIPALISKANPGESDADGNYIFTVEASNENLDLQNQIVQQEALLKSKHYFLTNGIISDDHQHKRTEPDGTVVSDKTKIIGQPLEVWTEGTKTFVKGKLFGNVTAAKPFIDFLKAKASIVKASVGGILPKVTKNPDGTETVTSFMWNDLALTCSPVNSTVGSAVFAKSLSNVDFCKALTATPSTTDSAELKDGAAMVKEDLEKPVVDVVSESVGEEESEEDKEKNKLEKAITETIIALDTGEISSREEMINYLESKELSKSIALEVTDEIIEQGGEIMAKSHFSETIDTILKSFGKKDCEDLEKSEKKDEVKTDDSEIDFGPAEDIDLSEDDDEKDGEDAEDDGAKKVEKSLDDEPINTDVSGSTDVVDATEVLNEISKSLAELTEKDVSTNERVTELEKSIMLIANTVKEFMETPVAKKSVTSVTKSLEGSDYDEPSAYVAPTSADFELFKSCLCNAKKAGVVDLRKSVHLESVFQSAVRGNRMNTSDEELVRKIYKEYK